MGSSLPSSVALFVCLSLLHCVLLETVAAGGAKPQPSTTPVPHPDAAAATGPARRSANSALLKDNAGDQSAQKKILGKGYGGYVEQPEVGYGSGPSNYGPPQHGYGYNEGGYGYQQGYGAPQQSYGYQEVYGQPQPGYGGLPQGYGHYQQGYSGAYGQQQEGYGGGYGQEQQGYGHYQQDGYGPQNYEYPGQQEYHGQDNYGKQGYGDSSYAIHGHGPFHYDNGYGYSYDTHYCSVHGSFSLALSHQDQGYGYHSGNKGYGGDSKKDGYGSDNKDDGYGENNKEGYGSEKKGYGGKQQDGYGGDSYGPKKHNYKPRFHTRQYCRYAAAASERSCKFCCRVVARSSNTSPDEIVSAIFNFDPVVPTANGAGFDYHNYEQHQKQEEGYSSDNKDTGYGSTPNKPGYGGGKNYNNKSAFQCVCCAPNIAHHPHHYKK